MISPIRQDFNRFTDEIPILLYKRQGAIIHSFPLEVGGVWTHIITEFGVELHRTVKEKSIGYYRIRVNQV